MNRSSSTRRTPIRAATVAAIAAGGSAMALAVGGVMLAAPAQAAAALPPECVQTASTVTCSYASIGAEQQFTVPAGITVLHVDLVGARGFSPNALSAEVVDDLAVTPGTPLYVEVGGMGGVPSLGAVSGNVTPGGAGGFNGGGAGGDAVGAPFGLQSGGGGGGASDLRTCSSSDTACATLDSRLLIAGGSGGVGGLSAGGNGGTPNGQDGHPDNPNSLPGAGGTQTAGGAPGGNTGSRGNPLPGHPGSYGAGGQGGPVGTLATAYGGGGGGGGLFGGGGGNAEATGLPAGSGSAGGGGGGSSYGPPGATISLNPFSTVPASVTISYAVPATAPTAPTVGSATAGDGSASLAFTPPSSDGGATISGYTVTSNPGGVTATGTTSPIAVTGLTNGTSYTFTVTATNSVGTGPASAPSNPVTPTAPIAPLAISTTSPLPSGTVGSPYTTTLTATGGTAAYAWSLGSGSTLPAGLTLHPDGTLTGTPTAAGPGSFTVQVSDAAVPAQTATADLTVTITAAPPKRPDLGISLTHLGRFVKGQYGWYQVQITNTGTAATKDPTTVATTLPRGLSLLWAYGPVWTCGSHGQSGSCTRTMPLAAHATSTILVLVGITAPATTVLTVTGTVAPTDATPADNTSTDRVQVQAR